jgi:hypothetical protein
LLSAGGAPPLGELHPERRGIRPPLTDILRSAIKSKFQGLTLINGPGGTDPYNDGLASDLIALGTPFPIRQAIDTTAWHREIVKMALGLACMTFGDAFTTSAAAEKLRTFLREDDAEQRATMGLHGFVGLGDAATPVLSKGWHPGGDEHLFALVESDGRIVFVANLFGRFENFVEISRESTLMGKLSGALMKGVCWLVDPETKTTSGPTPIEGVIPIPNDVSSSA